MTLDKERAGLDDAEKRKDTEMLTIAQIANDIDKGLKRLKRGPYQNENSRWELWEKNRKRAWFCVWDEKRQDRNYVADNIPFANHNTIRPTLSMNDPKMRVKSTRPQIQLDVYGQEVLDEAGRPVMVDNRLAAKVLELKANYELKEMSFSETLGRCLTDVLAVSGVGWLKIGYSNKTVSRDNHGRGKLSFWIKRVDPRNVVYSWNASTIDESSFVAERIFLTRRKAKKLGIKVPDHYVATLPDFMKSDGSEEVTDSEELVIVWEYRDLETGWTYTYLDGDNSEERGWAREPQKDIYPFEGSSLEPLVFNKNNDDIIGLSDNEPIADQVEAINRLKTKQVKHVDSFGSTVLVTKGMLSDKQRKALQDKHHLRIIEFDEVVNGQFSYEGTPAMGQDNYAMASILKEDARTTLGITDYQQGGAASRKATEASIIQQSAFVRIEERKKMLRHFLIRVFRKLSILIQHFAPEEDFLDLNDEELSDELTETLKGEMGFNPKLPFLYYTREQLQGEMDFDVNVDDMFYMPKEVRAQQWMNFLQVILSNPMTASEFLKKHPMDRILEKTSELMGIDLGDIEPSGPISMTPERENEMFRAGMEVKDPHESEPHDDHLLSHGKYEQELVGQQQKITLHTEKLNALTQQASVLPVDRRADVADVVKEQMARLSELNVSIQEQLRKVRLHMQLHEEMRVSKESTNRISSGAIVMPLPSANPVDQLQRSQQVQGVPQNPATGGV